MPGPKKRSRVSESRRLRIYQRDNYTCRYCGRPAMPITLDHVIPLACGGSNEERNLVTACSPCNQKKGNRTPQEWGRSLIPLVGDQFPRLGDISPRQRRIHFFSETTIARQAYNSKEAAIHHSCIWGWIFRDMFYIRCPGCDYYHLGPLPEADQRSYHFTAQTEQDMLELGDRAAAWMYLENEVVSKRRRQNIRYRLNLARMIRKGGYSVALPISS